MAETQIRSLPKIDEEFLEIEPHPAIMNELEIFLESKGHQCVRITETKDHQFKWCQKDVCLATVKHKGAVQQDKENKDFITKLRIEGHICIRMEGESFPQRFAWCQQNPCKKNKGG
jgi:hypothetical protein